MIQRRHQMILWVLGKMFQNIQVIVTIDKNFRDEKIRYNINREAAKILVLSSGKIDKHEYFTGEHILLSGPSQIIQQAKFTCSFLEKAFEKEKKVIKYQGDNKIEAVEKQCEKQLAILNDIGLYVKKYIFIVCKTKGNM